MTVNVHRLPLRLVVRVAWILCALALVTKVAAQDLPNYDILLYDLGWIQVNDRKTLSISNVRTVANSADYENQPYFVSDNHLYYTRMVEAKTDIWQWQEGAQSALVKTEESEYSPTLMPNSSNALSTVRVEADGTQRLWRYHPETGFQLLFKNIKPVGYHAWQDNNIAMFVLGEPHSLQVTQLGKDLAKLIDKDIGRCLQTVPGSKGISYTRVVDGRHQLRSYYFPSAKQSAITMLPGQSQDYAWLDKTIVVSADGDKLLWFDTRELDNSWRSVRYDSERYPIAISRIAISPSGTQIALVVETK